MSSPEPRISIEDLAKTYRVTKRGRTVREVPALRGVSAAVGAGEILGVVGTNGSGKTTLLRALAKVTRPTAGRAELHGRVIPLLGLAAGQPESSGLENALLLAALWGVPRSIVQRQLDDIVAFAGLGDQISLPVKGYSTGMRLRLAFAVATHVEADVLLIDEVLAVGDQAFQQQCLDRLDEMRATGCATIVVSHDLPTVRRLCDKAVWLEDGHVAAEGAADTVTRAYAAHATAAEEDPDEAADDQHGRPLALDLVTSDGSPLAAPERGDALGVRCRFEIDSTDTTVTATAEVYAGETLAFRVHSPADAWPIDNPGVHEVVLLVPGGLLTEHEYRMRVIVELRNRDEVTRLDQGDALRVSVRDPDATGAQGAVRPEVGWDFRWTGD
ncbi:MAG: ABC transporter ATP-binding protein [Solirubrobacterales bacterium]|nr:ABC transporter ATP-binding protein [Solirubrobacterales bacterium]